MELEEVGIIVSPTSMDTFHIVPHPNADIRKRDFCLIKHPKTGVPVLARVYSGTTENLEMRSNQFGAILARQGYSFGREHEVTILRAEILGYKEDDGFVEMDYPPSPGSPVYKCDSPFLIRPFLRNQEGIQFAIGEELHSGLPVSLALDPVTKGHMAVCGMTRSGKTTFVMSLIEAGSKNDPPARFIVFDRTGEYQPLKKIGATVIDGREFRSFSQLKLSTIAGMFGLETKGKAGKSLAIAIRSLVDERNSLDERSIIDRALSYVTRDKERIASEIEVALRFNAKSLNMLKNLRYEVPNVIESIRSSPIVIVDLSTDLEIFHQQLTFVNVMRQIFNEAIRTRGEAFTCIVVVEEAQFYAPERGVTVGGDPLKSGSLNALTASCSQLGGYNVGFIIVSQRPAYVSKAVLSQCNTFAVFRMMSKADHDQLASATGYPAHRISELLTGLPDHVFFLVGMANPFEFPIFVKTRIRLLPRKASISASQILARQSGSRLLTR